MWATGTTSAKIGFTTDHGATFTAVIVSPNAGQSIQQITITTNFMWVLLSAGTSKSGQLWRSPAPNASGSNIAFTKIFDLTGMVNGPGGAGADSMSNTSFRNACLAVQSDESRVYLITYGNGNDTLNIGSITDAFCGFGSDIVYSPSQGGSDFVGCVVGASVTLAGAGAGGALLSTTIAEVISSKKIRLADCAQTGVAGATLTFPSQTFGASAVIGGPKIYVSSNANGAAGSITFASGQQFAFAKHGHAVQIIGGVPWVSLGDMPYPPVQDGIQPTSHVGLWAATDVTGTAWNLKMGSSFVSLSPYDMINFFPITVGGQTMIVGESDSALGPGPIFFPSQSNAAGTRNCIPPVMPTDLPQVATMRCLTITPEGNLMWLGTGENGAVGPVSTIMLAKPPFSAITPVVVLESTSTDNFGVPFLGNAITDGAYVWFGRMRITREKFYGQ
jgi:hypothetical protein